MKKTKKNIILAAIELFNQSGVPNVRNSDIAEKAGISLSNFNYHFRAKKDLVHAIIDYMVSVLEERVYGNRMLISEGQGLEITKGYFEFEQEFSFFYLDTYNLLQSYPELQKEVIKRIDEAIHIMKNLNYLSVGMGAMKPEPVEYPGLYDKLAEQMWVSNHFLLAQMRIRSLKEDPVIRGLETVYGILYPYLTERGISSYRAFIDNLINTKSKE